MKRLLLPVAALLIAACGQETPTGVGSRLLPSDVIQSFEVVLEPARYLVLDSAFGFYGDPPDASFMVLANQWDDALDSRILARYVLPVAISVLDSSNVLRSDSMPRFIGGDLVFLVDTVNSTPAPARLALFRNTEDWDESATWTLRVDTAGVRLPWAVPGGSPGIRVDTASWVAGRDTVRLPVDSATLRLWTDTTNAQRGAVVIVETQGARLRTSIPTLEVRARSSIRDTVVTATVFAPQRTFIFQPDPGKVSATPRVGGVPTWRTYFRLRERLDTVTVPCPGVNCRLRLSQASINRAAMLLQPVPSPRGLAPEAALEIGVYLALPTAGVPLERLPISDLLSATSAGVPPASFMTAGAAVVEVPVTDLVLNAVRGQEADTTFRPTHFALLPAGLRTFGFGSFQQLPPLRLVITTAKEFQTP